MGYYTDEFFAVLAVELIDDKAVLSISDALTKLVPFAPQGVEVNLSVGDTYGQWSKLTHASLVRFRYRSTSGADRYMYSVHLTDGEWE